MPAVAILFCVTIAKTPPQPHDQFAVLLLLALYFVSILSRFRFYIISVTETKAEQKRGYEERKTNEKGVVGLGQG